MAKYKKAELPEEVDDDLDEPGEYVRTERRGRVFLVTLHNPEKLNTYDGPGLKRIGEVWQELDDDPDLRAGVITGWGINAFCAGADVEAAATGGFDDPPYPEVAMGLAAKPVLAAIEGRCLGGGMMIATGCDLRVAGAGATFGLPEARWNLPAQWLGTLAQQLAPAHALELALMADKVVPAQRMYEMGWLNRVVPTGLALKFAIAMAERVADLAPRAIRYSKELIVQSRHLTPEEALALGHEQAQTLIGMRDTVEGAVAFAEERPPNFEDR